MVFPLHTRWYDRKKKLKKKTKINLNLPSLLLDCTQHTTLIFSQKYQNLPIKCANDYRNCVSTTEMKYKKNPKKCQRVNVSENKMKSNAPGYTPIL